MQHDRIHQESKKGFCRDQSHQLRKGVARRFQSFGWRLRLNSEIRTAEGIGVPDVGYVAAAVEFGDKELADLTYAIGVMNVFNRLGVTFRTLPAAATKG
jgi:hypothetical protein